MLSITPLFLLFQSSDILIPQIGHVEQLSMQALLITIIWMLWKAFREKDSQLQEMMRQMIESDTKQAAILSRVESLLQSLKH